MHRRDFLRGLAGAGVVGVAGCLGSGASGDQTVVLSEPDREIDPEKLPFPTWGDPVPDVTLPAPLEDREVTLADVENPSLLTFFYSHCNTVCPVLVSTMHNVQAHAAENGYADAVEFFPVTFDPARDDAERLREYAEGMNIDYDAGNWHFLRPESAERSQAVVGDQFGVGHTKSTPTPSENGSGGDEMGYMFMHVPMTMLVNGRGYVERAYRTKRPDFDTLVADLEAVRTA
ncbi:SCO family protein [Halobacteriales archaeon Cl-PHB]